MVSTPTVAFVLAGGEGSRLRPFTEFLPKPALPFAGRCRIIDFALSNLVHSGIGTVFVLMQYRPQPLLEHLGTHWSRPPGGARIVPVLPTRPFLGTADAVRQNLPLLDGIDPEVVAVFAADHVYRMDVAQMLRFHQGHAADATVAALPVPLRTASQFGVIAADADGRIRGFEEKPARPRCCPHDPASAYVSMGNYLFRPPELRRALREAARDGGHDFGHDVLPLLVREARVHAYDFRRNRVPGMKPFEEPAYWRDVGTVDAYLAAQDDTAGPQPRLDLDNPAWPIGGRPVRTPAPAAALPSEAAETASAG